MEWGRNRLKLIFHRSSSSVIKSFSQTPIGLLPPHTCANSGRPRHKGHNSINNQRLWFPLPASAAAPLKVCLCMRRSSKSRRWFLVLIIQTEKARVAEASEARVHENLKRGSSITIFEVIFSGCRLMTLLLGKHLETTPALDQIKSSLQLNRSPLNQNTGAKPLAGFGMKPPWGEHVIAQADNRRRWTKMYCDKKARRSRAWYTHTRVGGVDRMESRRVIIDKSVKLRQRYPVVLFTAVLPQLTTADLFKIFPCYFLSASWRYRALSTRSFQRRRLP